MTTLLFLVAAISTANVQIDAASQSATQKSKTEVASIQRNSDEDNSAYISEIIGCMAGGLLPLASIFGGFALYFRPPTSPDDDSMYLNRAAGIIVCIPGLLSFGLCSSLGTLAGYSVHTTGGARRTFQKIKSGFVGPVIGFIVPTVTFLGLAFYSRYLNYYEYLYSFEVLGGVIVGVALVSGILAPLLTAYILYSAE